MEVNANTLVPTHLRAKWKNYIHYSALKPDWYSNKWKIITWSCYWPMSIVWTVLNEPWRYIYEMLSGVYQRIADSIYKRAGLDQDLSYKVEASPDQVVPESSDEDDDDDLDDFIRT
jgi:hypothetical protein